MEMTLNLPRNYIEIEEEMMCLDGGWIGFWNHRDTVGAVLDVALACLGIRSIKGQSAQNWISKNSTKAVNKAAVYFGMSAFVASKVRQTVGAIAGIAGISIGYILAWAIDGADGWFGGKSWSYHCFE